MTSHRPSHPRTEKKDPNITIARIGIITAAIAALGVIASAAFNYLGTRSQIELPIQATNTAVAALTLAAPAAPTLPSTTMPPAPTMTPAPTRTPAPTETTAPTISPTPTATPAPRAHITNLVDGDSVAQYITLLGEYRADLADSLWVFVQDPNQLYYPQSMAPCEGESTPKHDGRWEIRVGVGVTTSTGTFNLVLTVADAQADRFISTLLQTGCTPGGSFAGFPELPSGVAEVQRLRVTRLPAARPEDSYGPMPLLSNANLPGQITVSNIGSSGRVAPEEIISGTVSGAGDLQVWVLVYTFYGRWYPQSFDPCQGLHTITTAGRWQAKAIFGGQADAGRPFDVAVIVADAQAQAFFDARQREWCRNSDYPGLLTIDLPAGITEKYRTRVIRR